MVGRVRCFEMVRAEGEDEGLNYKGEEGDQGSEGMDYE